MNSSLKSYRDVYAKSKQTPITANLTVNISQRESLVSSAATATAHTG